MRRTVHSIWSSTIGSAGHVIAYGHYGPPVLAFASSEGRATDWEERGMVGAVESLIDDGRLKLYCVDSFDSASWYDRGLSLDARAMRHNAFEQWIIGEVMAFISEDCGGAGEAVATGASMGAYHAANVCLRRADLFPLAVCMSGIYDLSVLGGDGRSSEFYFHNPMDYIRHANGDHLGWLRSRARLVLVCGQGQWEDTTGALDSTKAFGRLLAEKGIRNEVDLWGWDVPHDWPSWRRQLAHHLPLVLA